MTHSNDAQNLMPKEKQVKNANRAITGANNAEQLGYAAHSHSTKRL